MYNIQNDIEAPLFLVVRVWRSSALADVHIPALSKVTVMYSTDDLDQAESYYLDALKTFATEISEGQFRIEIYRL